MREGGTGEGRTRRRRWLEVLRKADRVEREEDELYGVGRTPEDLPQELKRRESRLEKIRQAKAELEREAAQARAAHLRELAAGQEKKAADSSVEPLERDRAWRKTEKSRQKARELEERSSQPGASAGSRGRG